MDLKPYHPGQKENPVFKFFYAVGLWVIKIWSAAAKIFNFLIPLIFSRLKKFSRKFAAEISATKNLLPKRLKIIKELNFSKAIAAFIILATISFAGVKFLNLMARALQLKNDILGSSLVGNKYLDQAKNALINKNFGEAGNKFFLAYKAFAKGQESLGSTNILISQLANNLPATKSAQSLLSAAKMVSLSGSKMAEMLQNFQGVNFTAQGLNISPKEAAKLFARLNENLDAANSYLGLAEKEIASVDELSMPKSYRQKVLDIKNQFSGAKTSFDSLYKILKLALKINQGKKHILLLFENNNELRATGGFMGTFGSLYLSYGKINKIEISSIYDLDGQLLEKISPPSPMLNVNDRWTLRDSNWFADFPSSARKITAFYEKEGGETPDLVIALTPNLIVDFLKALGPVNMPKYNLILNSDNFIEQTQLVSSVNYANFDSFENKPKQVLADFFPILMQKIGEASPEQTLAILQSLENNLVQKQILLFSKDNEVQKQLESLNWAGEVLTSDRDFLSVNSSNLGGTKTDLFIDQDISLKSSLDSSGEIINELKITRKNKLPKMDSTENTSFLRVFAPLGSTLISNVGFDKKNLETPDSANYKIDPDVYEWEKNSVKDVLTGTLIGKESEKTFFGNWLTLKGGEERTVTLIYKLPFKLAGVDHYSLLLQKQAGTLSQNFHYRLQFPERKIEWQNFNPESLEIDYLETSRPLDRDLFMGEVFTLR